MNWKRNYTMNDSESLVRVTILGQEYAVKAPTDPDYIRRIADYVNAKMNEVQSAAGPEQNATRIAILAAMNISDELFTVRKECENLSRQVDERVTQLMELVDDTLEG
ncbi:MAG: cell division protein ZapA [Candidatus Neomarinimicrobiota bacterium]|nr:MAG: cell division protein ZapA [Candidatus Neomarinimicrobiota bacterium]